MRKVSVYGRLPANFHGPHGGRPLLPFSSATEGRRYGPPLAWRTTWPRVRIAITARAAAPLTPRWPARGSSILRPVGACTAHPACACIACPAGTPPRGQVVARHQRRRLQLGRYLLRPTRGFPPLHFKFRRPRRADATAHHLRGGFG